MQWFRSCCLLAIFYVNIVTLNGRILLLLSFSFTMLSLGQHMSTRTRPFNMDERTGLLDAYNPPIHPSTLEMVFSDLVKTHMDPLLRSEYEVYSKEIESYILPKNRCSVCPRKTSDDAVPTFQRARFQNNGKRTWRGA